MSTSELTRKINRETDFSGGAYVALPDEMTALSLPDGISAEIILNPAPELLRKSDKPIILIGNLTDSHCAEYLYNKLMICTDLFYPGNGGYELRTLCDPFGTGSNIIFLGYSDSDGREKGLKRLFALLSAKTPFLMEIMPTNLLCSEKYVANIKNSEAPTEPDAVRSIHASYWWYAGMLYYQTGDAAFLRIYTDGFKRFIAISEKNASIGGGTHLYMLTHLTVWRYLELSGSFPDELREGAHRLLYNWLGESEGIKYVRANLMSNCPTHNHTMFCALASLLLTY